MNPEIRLPFFKGKVEPSHIALYGSEAMLYVAEQPLVNVESYIPESSKLYFQKALGSALLFGGRCFANVISKIATSYKCPTIAQKPESVVDFLIPLGVKVNYGVIKGDLNAKDVREALGNELLSWLARRPSDAALSAMIYEFNQTPIPLETSSTYLLEFAEKNGIDLSKLFGKEYDPYKEFMAAFGVLQPSRRIAYHLINDKPLISGPKLEDHKLAEKVTKDSGLGNVLNEISDHPCISVKEQKEKAMDLMAAGAIEMVFDEEFKDYYAVLSSLYEELAKKFITNDPLMGRNLAKSLIKCVGRMRTFGIEKLPKKINPKNLFLNDAGIICVTPLLDSGIEMYDADGTISDLGKQVISISEMLTGDIVTNKLMYYFSGKRAEKVRDTVVKKVYNQNRILY